MTDNDRAYALARRHIGSADRQTAIAACDVLAASNAPADIALVREKRMRLFAQPGAEIVMTAPAIVLVIVMLICGIAVDAAKNVRADLAHAVAVE